MQNQDLLQLYAHLHRIRRIEEVIAALYPQQEMRCPVHLCTGQEAVPVGICTQLKPADYVFSAHRSHGHYLAKGGSLKALLGELYGKATGCATGKGGSMHLIDRDVGFIGAVPILGASIAIAVGAALGSVMRGDRRVTAVFFGDGAIEEGIFYEAANYAVLRKLPVLFVCENNELSMYSKMDVRQPAGRQVHIMAKGIGLKSAAGDGNDVLEVVRQAKKALSHVRRGNGPMFLELRTCRWREHCGPNEDAALGLCTPAEAAMHKAQCPLKRLKAHMLNAGVWDDAWVTTRAAEIEREIDEAVEFARSSPFPDPDMLFRDEYAGAPAYYFEEALAAVNS